MATIHAPRPGHFPSAPPVVSFHGVVAGAGLSLLRRDLQPGLDASTVSSFLKAFVRNPGGCLTSAYPPWFPPPHKPIGYSDQIAAGRCSTFERWSLKDVDKREVSRIFQQIEDIQIRISQCEQELKSHKSPRFEYEERLADVNTRIDEAWERLFSGQSPIDRSELQSKILNYGRVQRLLTSVVSMLFGKTRAKGLSQYWNLCCFQIHRKKQKTGSSSKHFRMGQLEISRKALNRQHPSNQLGVVGLLGGLARRPLTPAAKATGLDRMIQPQWKRRRITESQERHSDDSLNENDGQLQDDIARYLTPGEVYLAFKSDAWSPVLLLPTDNLHDVGLPITIEALGLTKNVPHCYEYDREEKSFRWRKEYEGGGRLFAERQYPIIFFDGLDFPERSSVGWVAARDLRSFDLMDANIDKRIKHVGRVRQFVNEREKSRAKDKDDASASQRARSVDGDDTRSLGAFRLTPKTSCGDQSQSGEIGLCAAKKDPKVSIDGECSTDDSEPRLGCDPNRETASCPKSEQDRDGDRPKEDFGLAPHSKAPISTMGSTSGSDDGTPCSEGITRSRLQDHLASDTTIIVRDERPPNTAQDGPEQILLDHELRRLNTIRRRRPMRRIRHASTKSWMLSLTASEKLNPMGRTWDANLRVLARMIVCLILRLLLHLHPRQIWMIVNMRNKLFNPKTWINFAVTGCDWLLRRGRLKVSFN
ncbi:uncharacterized protein HRG_11184 [Hirsutella rhossiliensis]|uniref:Uncharacterized protein n=1 Tax=Hirsutella rhossiliensis TaxID=111463 RepID=A0A9P8SCJ2_9HYPO|nr:uncharacterized protein HRG_11184 [Hirsutella rhossiliensis]KAH0957693.1 hypothetical protein HRG_11184 [Hirsutella rhossiliensis]